MAGLGDSSEGHWQLVKAISKRSKKFKIIGINLN
jgi:hypothetical protein